MPKVKISAISDIHGYLLPVTQFAGQDLLLIAGDIAGNAHTARKFYWSEFDPWLRKLRMQGVTVIGIAGNHDVLFEQEPDIPYRLAWTYLADQACEFCGLRIYGTPWQPKPPDLRIAHDSWAFGANSTQLEHMFSKIPSDLDILLAHGPPLGCLDSVPISNSRYNSQPGVITTAMLGSSSMAKAIVTKRPKIAVFGHIHESYGVATICETTAYNAAVVNAEYQLTNAPHVFELESR